MAAKLSTRTAHIMPGYEAGWVAGIIEGEGSIGTNVLSGRHYARIEVVSTDEDVIDRLVDWTGIGRKTGPYQPPASSNGKKLQWRWKVQARSEVLSLMAQVSPLLLERRSRRWFDVRKEI